MAHYKSAAITTTYFEVKYSTCVCSHVRITLWINAVDFVHTFSALFVSSLTVGPIQHCNWPLCFIMLCMCCEIYAVWCLCLIWHNGAYVRSLSRGATCHEGPLFLWTSGGRRWQVLLYFESLNQTGPNPNNYDNVFFPVESQTGHGPEGSKCKLIFSLECLLDRIWTYYCSGKYCDLDPVRIYRRYFVLPLSNNIMYSFKCEFFYFIIIYIFLIYIYLFCFLRHGWQWAQFRKIKSYKQIRNSVTELIRSSKKYYENCIEENHSNPKGLWKVIKKLTDGQSKVAPQTN